MEESARFLQFGWSSCPRPGVIFGSVKFAVGPRRCCQVFSPHSTVFRLSQYRKFHYDLHARTLHECISWVKIPASYLYLLWLRTVGNCFVLHTFLVKRELSHVLHVCNYLAIRADQQYEIQVSQSSDLEMTQLGVIITFRIQRSV